MALDVGSLVARRRTWSCLASVVVVSAALALVASGCSPSSSSTSTGSDTSLVPERLNTELVENDDPPVIGGKIVYGLNAESNGWNPGTNQWAPAGLTVMRTFFDTLVGFDQESVAKPYAGEFTPTADYSEWRVKLRPGMVFHNGKPVTAEAVARDQNYLRKSPITKQAYPYTSDVVADGPDVVVFKMTKKWITFPQIFATQVGVIADPDWLESNDGIHPVGSGPFMMDKWEIGNKLVVKKNPHYWQKDQRGQSYPYLDEVEFRVITDNNSRAAALESGDVDIIEASDPPTIERFQDPEKRAKYQVFSNSKAEMAEVFVMLNTKVAPFDDIDARRALAYATDKRGLIDQVGGLFEPANGPYAPGSPYYSDSGYPQYDPVQAKALVQKVKDSHGGAFKFTLSGSAETSENRLLQGLQQQWRDVGIDVDLDSVEQAKLIIEVVTGGFQAVKWQQFDSAGPSNDDVWWLPDNALDPPAFTLNFARYRNDDFTAAFERQRESSDLAVQQEALSVVQKGFGRDVPYVWLWHAQIAIIASKRLVNVTNYKLPDGSKGLDLHMEAHPLYQVWLTN